MKRTNVVGWVLMLAIVACGTVCRAAEWGLKEGTPELKSAGSLAFGPEGILFVGDAKGATVFAIATGDVAGEPLKVKLNIDGLNAKVAELLGSSAADAVINDLAVNPVSGNAYLSVTNGDKGAALVKIDSAGKLSEVSLKKVSFSKAVLANAPEDKVVGEGRRRGNLRDQSITDLAYIDGRVIVSGLSSEAAPSTVRELAFPFSDAVQGVSIEIYHGAHGRFETTAVVRTFVPFNIGDEPALLASFQCTPLVKFPLSSLKSGQTVRGTTVAELGNQNRPLDMIVYKKDGQDFLLIANSSRGVMKVSTENIERAEGIEERISDTAGQKYDTIKELQGVVQLDKLNAENALILVQTDSGEQNLKTVELP